MAWLAVGKLDSAQQAFASAARDTSDVAASGYLGLTLARRGERAGAQKIGTSLGAIKRNWLFGSNTLWRAAISSELGEHEAAVRLLGQAYQEGSSKEFWHFYNPLRSLRGFKPFEALITTQ